MAARLLATACLLLLVLTACGDEEAASPAAEPGATGDATTEPAGHPATGPTEDPAEHGEGHEGVVVAVAGTDLGDVLVDGDGLTLYLFDNDEQGMSTCYEACAQNWPPLLSEGEAEAGEGADAALLGSTGREDGQQQVTYAGHPLYYFVGDSAPGEVTGQGVQDIWWVLSPAGEAVRGLGDEDDDRGRDYDY